MPVNVRDSKKGFIAHASNVALRSCLVLSLALFSAVSLAGAPAQAYAEDIDTDPVADEFQQQIEESATAYSEASARVEELDQQIEENTKAIAELEEKIPQQKERANDALVELYKAQEDMGSVLNFILTSESFSDFITRIDYFNIFARTNMAEIEKLSTMQAELEQTRSDLESEKQEAEERATAAQIALEQAQAARIAAQQKAQEEAAAANANAPAASFNDSNDSNDSSDSNNSDNSANANAESTDASNNGSSAADTDTANWTSDEDAFVAEWATRINNYLAGSTLAGYGETFARAAWTYGVDPRWSPAIAYVESSLGAHCFKSHNAWGWGSVSWDSWESAIYSHVAGLARGYGYTLTYTAAQKYCPPNTDHWYSTCLAQMNRI